uniref:Uncharacterized protein n=1 Tax=Alexandrium monilatum TaxID=311494 RepID=A0A7S4R9D5_9DINO
MAGHLPWGLPRTALLLMLMLALLGSAAAAAAIAAEEGQCSTGSGAADCPGASAPAGRPSPGLPAQFGSAAASAAAPLPPPQLAGSPASAEVPAETEKEARAPEGNLTGMEGEALSSVHPREELSHVRVGFVLSLVAFLLVWIIGSIKFAVDGSLPARLALWGLFPEAYAAVSVRSVVALLRLKAGQTPVVVLQSCVCDKGAVELADALGRYGRKAGLQALELPHNPAMSEVGLKHLAAAILAEDSPPLQELDVSYNPQLGDDGAELLLPLLKPTACQVNELKLADCGLSVSFVERLAEKVAMSSLRVLDLSNNVLTGAGEAIAALCEAPVLEELTLGWCRLRPEDVAALAKELPYTSLRSLHLGGNRFGGPGLAALAEHLPRSQIDELGLERNDLEVGDLGTLGEAWAKRPFSRLRLDGNRMSQAEVARFIRALKSIHT